jgi:indolepyruvate ferredoxin oxidoreductase
MAFEWGRHAAHHLDAVEGLLKPVQVIEFKKRTRLEDLIAQRVDFLTNYQNANYAEKYKKFIDAVHHKEQILGKTSLTETVARQLFKLMAYKDEYEVARLHTDKQFLERIQTQFEGDFKVFYHLAPPLVAKRNEKGQLLKQKMSPHMQLAFQGLARLKFLRGTFLDIFGRTEERQTERALIQEYMDAVSELLVSLNSNNHALAKCVSANKGTHKANQAIFSLYTPNCMVGNGTAKAFYILRRYCPPTSNKALVT